MGSAGRAVADDQPKPSRMTAGYFGESVTNPGGTVGYEAAFYYRRPHELFAGAHIGGYNSGDPPGYGLLIYLEGGYRLNFVVGFFLEARVGLGYVNVTSDSGTSSDGSASSTTSSNYLMPLGMAGLGWDFLPRTRVPLSIYADVGGMGRYNQAEPFSGGLVLSTGLAYQFGTLKPQRAQLPVPSPPPAVAPPLSDSSQNPPPSPDLAPSPSSVEPFVPAEPAAPAAPIVPAEPFVPPGPVRPVAPSPPPLPPPPSVPAP